MEKQNGNITLLFIGDVVGYSGLECVVANLPMLKEKYSADMLVVNGENICNGKGLTEVEAEQIFGLGVDVITTGNHIWDNWASKPLMKANNLVLRPCNYPMGNVGRGFAVIEHSSGNKVCVVQVQGRTFMQTIDCPFKSIDKVLTYLAERGNADAIIVDFHAEATSEKVAMLHYLDGRVSAVIGTHTHIQTADALITDKGTAYITDVGMSGAYDSVLGLRKDVAINRYLYQTAYRYEPATEDNKVSGVVVKIERDSGKALSIENFVYPKFNNNKLSDN